LFILEKPVLNLGEFTDRIYSEMQVNKENKKWQKRNAELNKRKIRFCKIRNNFYKQNFV